MHSLAAMLWTDSYQIDATRTSDIQSFRTHTTGLQLSDDISSGKSTLGFGFYAPHEQESSDHETPKTVATAPLNPGPVLGQSTSNFFVREDYTFNPKLSIVLNAWEKHASVTNTTSLDPRLSLVFHPTFNDVIRFSAARVDDAPDTALINGAVSFSDPGSTNINCSGTTGVGVVPSTGLVNETGNDLELSFGHRFRGNSQNQVNVYSTNIRNQLIGTSELLSSVPQFETNPLFAGNLAGPAGYLAKFNKCAQFITNPLTTGAQLAAITTVNSTLNAAQGQYQGVEVTGRLQAGRQLYFDYSYDIQSARFLGLSDATLLRSANTINGNQRIGIPLHKASLGLDYNAGHNLEFRMDGFWIANNNGYNRPAYTFFNGAITKRMRDTLLNFGVQNIFNSATQDYGLIGDGAFLPYNPVFAAANPNSVQTSALAQGSEEFGL